MRIMIAIPCMDMIPTPFAESIMYMDKPNVQAICFQANSLIYDARNLISLRAIENGYDWVMWLDSDMVIPKNALVRLLDTAQKHDAQMVTGVYVKRSFPVTPVLYDSVNPPEEDANGNIVQKIHTYTNHPSDRVFQVEGCGFGCVLTSVPLLKRVWDRFGPAFTPTPWAGEDISFCYLVKQLVGYPILCDPGVQCGHVGKFIYSEKMMNQGGGDAGEKH